LSINLALTGDTYRNSTQRGGRSTPMRMQRRIFLTRRVDKKWWLGKDQTHKKNEMTRISTYLSLITLNVNDLNTRIKTHRPVDWIKKQNPNIYWLQEKKLTGKHKHMLKVKWWKYILRANEIWKQARLAILISHQADFKPKLEEMKKVFLYW
jgi:hypothetical protein